MTCIVGLIDNGKVYMGGDRAGVNSSYDLQLRRNAKIFTNGEFLIGYTTSFRMGQLLQYNFNPPKRKEGQDIFEFMVNDFIEAVRRCLKSGGFTKINNNEETGGTFLVGYNGRLFTIEDDFQVYEVLHSYMAVGCGASYALGALFKTDGQDSAARVKRALETAEYFSAGVRGPFDLLSIE